MKNNLTVNDYVKVSMLKRVLILFIGLSIFLQSLHQFVLTAQFVLQSTQKKLENCINKNNPQSDCKGKCQLARKLKTEEQKNDSTSVKNEHISDLFSESSFQFSLASESYYLSHEASFHQTTPTSYSEERLRPPAIL